MDLSANFLIFIVKLSKEIFCYHKKQMLIRYHEVEEYNKD